MRVTEEGIQAALNAAGATFRATIQAMEPTTKRAVYVFRGKDGSLWDWLRIGPGNLVVAESRGTWSSLEEAMAAASLNGFEPHRDKFTSQSEGCVHINTDDILTITAKEGETPKL